MAENTYLTQDQADELIGKTGLVIHPSKGEQGPPGGWECKGYDVDPEGKVVSLKLDSVAQKPDNPQRGEIKDPKTGERSQGVTHTIPSHPVEVRPRCNPRHFRPARDLLDGKPKIETSAAPLAAPAGPLKPAIPAK